MKSGVLKEGRGPCREKLDFRLVTHPGYLGMPEEIKEEDLARW
jgi:hypothetical protein